VRRIKILQGREGEGARGKYMLTITLPRARFVYLVVDERDEEKDGCPQL
jgi:hypothetical protein